MKRLQATALAACLIGTAACDRQPSPGGGPALSSPLGVQFVERSVSSGIRFRHTDGSSGKYYIVETLASGVGLIDFDDDGDLDSYFLNGRPLPPAPEGDASAPNALYENLGEGKFRDVTAAKGVPGIGFSVGCAAGDYDGDGDLDIYVAGLGPNVLYRNDGREAGWSFTAVTAEAGVDDARFSAGCAFLDIDHDGDLDLYVANYCEVDFASSTPCFNNKVPGYCAPGQYKPVSDSLFLNSGDGTFRDISTESGIDAEAKWGMGVVATDFDGDGWVDIYVANDVSENFLFKNLQGGKFKNVAKILGAARGADGDEQGSMGLDAADYDRDGLVDFVITNFQKQLNALYHNEGEAGFTDMAMAHGLGHTCAPMVSWGTKFFDFDHDGWLDLFIANGHLEDRIAEYDQSSTYLQRNQLFQNQGGAFKEVTALAGPGLRELFSSRGAAFGDIDNDGDIDIVVSNSRDRPSLLFNEGGNRRPWVMIECRGRKNRFAIGAKVTVTAGGFSQSAEVRSGGSYCSQNDLRLHFGLGGASRVDRVEVKWPGGGTTVREDLAINRLHRIEE
jgi:hypothetical protein